MNKLKCSVTTCRHNQNELCSLQKIQVDGPAAMESRETCCGSYAERTKSARNEAACGCGSASEQTDIHCSAAHCAYNENKKLSCGKRQRRLLLFGPERGSETECCTFQPRA